MNYRRWLFLAESSGGLPRKVMTALDHSFRVIVCEAVRADEEGDHERSTDLNALAIELEGVMEDLIRGMRIF